MREVKRKIVLVGDPSVGKTSLIRRFVQDEFDDKYIQTIGAKVSKKEVQISTKAGDVRVTLTIWDVVGAQGYLGVQSRSFTGAAGVLAVCDSTRPDTFRSLDKYWMPLLHQVTQAIPAVFLANKMDLGAIIPEDVFAALASKYLVPGTALPPELHPSYFTSAKTGDHVQDAFLALAHLIAGERSLDEEIRHRLLNGLEDGGLAELAEALASPDFRAQVARAVNDAVVRFLRTPLAERLWALGPDRLDGLERAAADYIVAALRAPATREWAVRRAREAIELGRRALVGETGRQRVAEAAHVAVRALLDRPIGRPANLLPPDAEARLRSLLTEPLWSWMQRQVPVLVSQLSVQGLVEQKVLGFSTARMEELIRNVTQRELTLIVRLGYVLGAIVGLVAWGINLLFA